MLEQHNAKLEHVLASPEIHLPQASVSGPRPTPLLGYFPEQLKFGRDPIGYLSSLYREYGTLTAWNLDKPMIVFSFDPAMYQILCSADQFDWAPKTPKPSQPSALQILSTSLLRMNGEEYKSRRRLVLPAFHQNLVEHWLDRMAALTRRALDVWQPGQEINLHAEMHRLVAAISISVVFNIEDPAKVKALDSAMYDLYFSSARVTSRLLPYDLPGSSFRRMHRIAEQIVVLLKEYIKESRGDNSMLAMLLGTRDEKGEGLDDVELLGEVYHLMNLDNLISSLTWTMLLLAQHPTVYADTLDEVQSVLRGDDPTLEQLGRLTLLDRVIKESLRLFPPFSIGRRFSIKRRRFGPFDLLAGSRVFFSQYITHRLPDIYSEPNRFLPQRWETLRPSLYEYLPFGAGSHYCLGMRFAMLELKVVLALMIQRYRLEVVPGARIDRAFRLVMETRQGVPMRISKQDRKFRSNPITGNIHEMVALE